MDQPHDKPIDTLLLQLPADLTAPPVAATQTHTLQDLATEHELFTAALLCTHGRFDRDPVREFARAWPTDVAELQPTAIDAEQPFFSGIGCSQIEDEIVRWDSRLYAIHKSRWVQCRDFIAAICAYSVALQHYMKVGYYTLQMLDQFAVKQQRLSGDLPQMPTVPITVFGTLTNSGQAMLLPTTAARAMPTLYVAPPTDAILLEASAVLGPPPDVSAFSISASNETRVTMKTIIQLPRDVEVRQLTIDQATRTITIDHLFLKRQPASPVAYLTVRGDGGMENHAVLMLDGKRGKFLTTQASETSQPDFDLPPDDFAKKATQRVSK